MAQGRYDEKLALDMAKKLLHDTAVEYFKL
jgi:hypothetical protein